MSFCSHFRIYPVENNEKEPSVETKVSLWNQKLRVNGGSEGEEKQPPEFEIMRFQSIAIC